MRQVYSYYNSTGFRVAKDTPDTSAIRREIVEFELMEQYHWLPQEIAKIPYKKMQKILLMKREKNNVINTKQSVAQFKAEQQNKSKSRKFTREV